MGGDLWVFYGLPPGPAALPGESVGRKGIGYPIGGFPTPKAFPSGVEQSGGLFGQVQAKPP